MADPKYMKRAIELAEKGCGYVNPNPMVGAVIVKDGRVIGEGWHKTYGGLHAEREALAALTENAAGADLYVTLEPCCHYGKQPPCTEAVIEAGIRRVFVGSDDPNPLVAGKGIKQLQEAGIEVQTGFLKEECDALNTPFFYYITTGLPYVYMKYAMTMDGKIACYTGDSQYVTGEKTRESAHFYRQKCAAIMVGIGTVLADDPMLTCRIPGGRDPVRVVCDSHLRIPTDCRLVRTAESIPLIVACGQAAPEKKAALEDLGVDVFSVPDEKGQVDLNRLMRLLGQRKIDSVLLEGGGRLNASALMAGIVRQAEVYIAPKIFGGQSAKTPVEGQGAAHPAEGWNFQLVSTERIGEDIHLTYQKR